MRVVTLLPSATEICFALGIEPVGVSHECDHPPEAQDLPAVNRSRIDPTGSSASINEQVARANDGDGVYAVDRERLAALDPDLVITQGVCDVCAVDRVLVEDAVAALDLDAEVLTLDVHSLGDLFEAIRLIGEAAGAIDRGEALVADLQARVGDVREGVPDDEPRPTVAVLDWMDPVMVAGHWVPEIVEIAGGEYGLEDAGAHSRPREWATILDYDPDVVIVSPCGFDVDQTRANLAELTDRPGWSGLSAVDNGRVRVVDGHHYVNRPGPRLADTCEIVASLLWPDVFDDPVPEAVATVRPSAV